MLDRFWIPFRLRLTDLHQDYLVFSCETQVVADPGSGMNIPDHFSESIETFLGLKILKLFDADSNLGSGFFLTLEPGWKNLDPV
jgi:hypothetical protein